MTMCRVVVSEINHQKLIPVSQFEIPELIRLDFRRNRFVISGPLAPRSYV
jgi:hypothetical protein